MNQQIFIALSLTHTVINGCPDQDRARPNIVHTSRTQTSQAKQGAGSNRPKKTPLLALIQTWLGALVVAIVRPSRPITRWRRLEDQRARLQTVRRAVLDALERHRLVGKLPTVSPRVPFFAKTHTISTIPVVVAIHRALFPSTIRTGIPGVAGARIVEASTVTTAASLAYAQAVGRPCAWRTLAANSNGFVVDILVHANSISRAISSARVRERAISSVDPLVTGHAKELLVAHALAEFLRAHSVARAVVGAGIDID